MKTLYLDLGMGASGDMLTAALLDLFPSEEREKLLCELNSLALPGTQIKAFRGEKCGIQAMGVSVLADGREEESNYHYHHHHHHDHVHDYNENHPEHNHKHVHDHSHSSFRQVAALVENMNIPEKVRKDIFRVYNLIAEAESTVHGKDITDIHFHEVGTKDAIMDVTAVCFLINKISPDEIIASPVHVGSGQVECAHGILPVPAPATALILRGIPIYGGDIKGELCTPTGAALLKHFVSSFSNMPLMSISSIGYGMGKRDYPKANCLRAILGEGMSDRESAASDNGSGSGQNPAFIGVGSERTGEGDEIIHLSCNIDDMTGEEIGYAIEKLFAAGAKDVYSIPIGMKKSRPGILLNVITEADRREDMLSLIFKHTSTLGIRELKLKRHVLKRREEEFNYGKYNIRRKFSYGYGVNREKLEYEDLKRMAGEEDISLREALRRVSQAFSENQGNTD